jgi:hypothetical protein
MTGTEHDGGCLCGDIRYRVTGALISTNICTCTQCQKHSGSPLPAFVTYRLDRFQLLAGTPAGFRSSDFAVRQFCPRCGSSLFWRQDNGDDIDIYFGTLDRPADLPPPADHIWAQHKAPWVPELPDVPIYPAQRTKA